MESHPKHPRGNDIHAGGRRRCPPGRQRGCLCILQWCGLEDRGVAENERSAWRRPRKTGNTNKNGNPSKGRMVWMMFRSTPHSSKNTSNTPISKQPTNASQPERMPGRGLGKISCGKGSGKPHTGKWGLRQQGESFESSNDNSRVRINKSKQRRGEKDNMDEDC